MIKLVLLKSGEEVITQIEEMVVNNNVVGYYFKKPCVAKLSAVSSEDGVKYNIKLNPWIPLSKDEIIPVVTDWVVTMLEPVDKLKTMYEEGIVNAKSESVDSGESDSGDTD